MPKLTRTMGTDAALAVLTSTSLSPTMTAREGSPPARRIAPVKWPGSGFAIGEGVAPGDRAEIAFKLKLLQEPAREIFALVGAHREPSAFASQEVERLDRAGEGPALHRDICLVMDEKVSEHGFEVAGDARPPQALLDHDAGAHPDERAHRFGRDRRLAGARQRIVQRIGQVWRGIDERAVEVEDDGGVLEHPVSVTRRLAAWQAAA